MRNLHQSFRLIALKSPVKRIPRFFGKVVSLIGRSSRYPLRNPIHIPFAVGLCAPAQIQKSGALCCTLLSDIWNYGLGCSDGRAASWGLGAGKSGALLTDNISEENGSVRAIACQDFQRPVTNMSLQSKNGIENWIFFFPFFQHQRNAPNAFCAMRHPYLRKTCKTSCRFFLKNPFGFPLLYIYN